MLQAGDSVTRVCTNITGPMIVSATSTPGVRICSNSGRSPLALFSQTGRVGLEAHGPETRLSSHKPALHSHVHGGDSFDCRERVFAVLRTVLKYFGVFDQ